MLAPEGYGEIVGGGERISDLNLLEKRMETKGTMGSSISTSIKALISSLSFVSGIPFFSVSMYSKHFEY